MDQVRQHRPDRRISPPLPPGRANARRVFLGVGFGKQQLEDCFIGDSMPLKSCQCAAPKIRRERGSPVHRNRCSQADRRIFCASTFAHSRCSSAPPPEAPATIRDSVRPKKYTGSIKLLQKETLLGGTAAFMGETFAFSVAEGVCVYDENMNFESQRFAPLFYSDRTFYLQALQCIGFERGIVTSQTSKSLRVV